MLSCPDHSTSGDDMRSIHPFAGRRGAAAVAVAILAAAAAVTPTLAPASGRGARSRDPCQRHLRDRAPRWAGRDHPVPPGRRRGGLPQGDGLRARRLVGRPRERVRRGLGVRRRALRHRHRDHLGRPDRPTVRPRSPASGRTHAAAALRHRPFAEQGRRREAPGHRLHDRAALRSGVRRREVRAGALRPERRRARWPVPEQPHRHPARRLAPGAAGSDARPLGHRVLRRVEQRGRRHRRQCGAADGAVGTHHRHRVGLPGRGRCPGTPRAGHRRVPEPEPRDARSSAAVRRHPPAAPDLHLQQQRVRRKGAEGAAPGDGPDAVRTLHPRRARRSPSHASTRWTSTPGPTR